MHPLAEACRRCHDFPDAIASAQAQGERLDARIAALASLTDANAEVKAHIWKLAQDLQAACTHQEPGATVAFWGWQRGALKTIRDTAEALFGRAPWVSDIH